MCRVEKVWRSEEKKKLISLPSVKKNTRQGACLSSEKKKHSANLILCRVFFWHSANPFFAECFFFSPDKPVFLPSVFRTALSKTLVCRVPEGLHLANPLHSVNWLFPVVHLHLAAPLLQMQSPECRRWHVHNVLCIILIMIFSVYIAKKNDRKIHHFTGQPACCAWSCCTCTRFFPSTIVRWKMNEFTKRKAVDNGL